LSGRGLAAFACAGIVALFSGCASRATKVTPPATAPKAALVASQQELVERYNRQAEGVRSLHATVRLKAETGSAFAGVIKEYRQITAIVLAQGPSSIRMIGQAPVVGADIFDMVSDGQTFRMYVPSKNQFLVGPAKVEQPGKKAIENLRPQAIFDSLLWPKIEPEETVVVEQAFEEQPPERDYVLTVLRRSGERFEVDRRIWFDRSDLDVNRVEIFGPGGRLESDVRYGGWSGEPTYPQRIALWRPQEDYRLEIDVVRVTLNEAIPAKQFELEQPAGSKLVKVGESGGKQ
jgi:outer membrane lipoprotein-sorting protein